MKICIPTNNDRGLDSTPSNHFGKAPFFVLADVEGGGLDVVRNPGCHEHHHACHHVRLLKAHDVDAVVCDGIGRQALAGLNDAGIDVLVSKDSTVSETVRTVHDGKAQPRSVNETCNGGECHSRRRVEE